MTGPLAQTDIAVLLSFGLGCLIAVCSIVLISGFLPRQLQPNGASGPFGGILIYGAAGMVAFLIVVLVMTIAHLPIAVAIIAAGLAVLAGPFLVEPIPRALRNSLFVPLTAICLMVGAITVLPWPF